MEPAQPRTWRSVTSDPGQDLRTAAHHDGAKHEAGRTAGARASRTLADTLQQAMRSGPHGTQNETLRAPGAVLPPSRGKGLPAKRLAPGVISRKCDVRHCLRCRRACAQVSLAGACDHPLPLIPAPACQIAARASDTAWQGAGHPPQSSSRQVLSGCPRCWLHTGTVSRQGSLQSYPPRPYAT
jgi:hypothetical protein